jgi:alpha-galactosidase
MGVKGRNTAENQHCAARNQRTREDSVTSTAGEPEAIVAVDDGALALTVSVGGDAIPRLTRLGPGGSGTSPAPVSPGGGSPLGAERRSGGSAAASPRASTALPLVDVLTPGTGRSWSGTRHAESALGTRLRYRGHSRRWDGPWQEFLIDLADPVSGLRAEACYRILAGQGVLRAWTTLTNEGSAPLVIESVTSFLCGALDGAADLDVLWAESDWLAEGRWQRRWLRDALPDLNHQVHTANPRGCLGFTSRGSWSCTPYLPMGALVSGDGACWCWQIEHNGGWQWEVGEARDGVYLALLGPAEAEHQWHQPLPPGASLRTVPVAVAVSRAGFEGAVGALTRYRRAIRRPHADHRELPVIFNDYMNTLMANPSTERLLPLISAAAEVGAEYFCIDAGWYDDGTGWWDSAGDWKPAPSRFPGGLAEVIEHIRAAGLVPGLWLEPEVAGIGTAAARDLPTDAFFQRGGTRVAEHGRYHLDLRHPAAVKHLDETVDFLVGDLGVGYLKLDYNIQAGPGTDTGGISAGAGLLGHNRALLDWLDRVLDRHPGLTIENCASGGMRADYAMLSRLQLQSTSDQQDFLRYPVIAAASAAAMTPEQAGIWAYPQPAFSPEQNAFTLCGALLGRIHLSGHLDRMTAEQRALVGEAVRVYKAIRADLAESVPFWPLGLPRWDDSWVVQGLRAPERSYLLVWRRGTDVGAPEQVTSPVLQLRGAEVRAEVMFGAGQAEWSAASGELAVTLPPPPAACLIRLTPA